MLVRQLCGPQMRQGLVRGVSSSAVRAMPEHEPAPAVRVVPPAPGNGPAAPAVAAAAAAAAPPVVPAPPASAQGSQGSQGPRGGPKRPKTSLLRQFMRLSGVIFVGGLGYFGYSLYDSVTFPQQTAPDPRKPRLVVIGSGWGSVALLKTVDMANYNVTVVSPRNYFLFTPLLPSTATGLIEHRSIMEPTRAILRKRPVSAEFVEGEVIKADFERKTVTVSIHHNSHKDLAAGIPDFEQEVPYDKLVIGVGATTNTYGIKGVSEYACFLKEIEDTQKIRKRIMDCLEAASVPGLPKETRRRLMHAVVVGGGPTGVEFAGELHDFVYNDLRKFNPDVVRDFKVSLIEGLPQILPSGFNKQLVNYAIDTLEREQIDILTKTMVTQADEEKVYATRTNPNGTKDQIELPYGLFVWAGGVGVRSIIRDMMRQIPGQAQARRGLLVDEWLQVKGVSDVWAVGDCADAGLAPTAQVASQEGVYVGTLLNSVAERENLREQRVTAKSTDELRHIDRHIKRLSDFAQFKYSHQGSLAYIGSDKAVADVTLNGRSYASGGTITYVFWRSAYLSMVFSLRNKLLVALDWTKVLFFGRDISRE